MRKPGKIRRLWLPLLLLLAACRKDTPDPSALLPAGNKWILDSMRVYYYWSDQLPGNPAPNTDAAAFFSSLLYRDDRFSWINVPGQPQTYSAFAWYGLEYALITVPSLPGRLIGVITLTVPGGPADLQGLKRGDCFTAVNNIEVNSSNTAAIAAEMRQGGGIQLQLAQFDGSTLSGGPLLNVYHTNFTEQPVYMARIFSNGGKKAGYLFYNFFDGQADQHLLDSLHKLKAAGISSLILDLRYNPGGDVSSAAKLAAVAAPVTESQPFVIYQANRNGGRSASSFGETISENLYPPNTFAEVSPYRLQLDKVVVLTGAATASAAELLINCLKPYINVVQVGDTTLGKDMGSFPIYDMHTPAQVNYTMHPLIFKLYNASNQGDYASGITPDHTVDEFSRLPLHPFGDPADPLISKALELTTGLPVSISGRMQQPLSARAVFSSPQSRSQTAVEVQRRRW